MNLLDFSTIFPNEAACYAYLKKQRERHGVKCKNCGPTKHYWLENQGAWKCSKCSSWTNIKAGTIMEKSKLPVRVWFMCIHLMTSTKKAFSALEMQRQLGLKRYEPVWLMMQKIRCVMGKKDDAYMLSGEMEMDEGFFEIVDPERKQQGVSQRGRGSLKQAPVLVMVESSANPDQPKTYKKNRRLGFTKMVVMDGLKRGDIEYEVANNVMPDATVLTDGYKGYIGLKEIVKSHKATVSPPNQAHKVLPWTHTVIANAKRLLLGIHHSIGKAYLQNYLNEYCYKLNRRYHQPNLFDGMLMTGMREVWY